MMSFLRTAVGERGGVLCPKEQERLSRSPTRRLCFCSDGWNPNGGSLFWASPAWKWGAEWEEEAAGEVPSSRHLLQEATYRMVCLHLVWVSNWSLYNPVCASIAPYRAAEGKEGVGKPLTPKADKAMKSGNRSFKHVPAPQVRQRWSWEERTEKVPFVQCSFCGPGDQQALTGGCRVSFSGSTVCPKKAARTEWFLLGCCRRGRSVAARREQAAPAPLGSSLGSSCLLRLLGVHQARLCCASSN